TTLVLHGAVEAACQRFWTETAERFRFLARDRERPCLPPAKLFLSTEEFFVAAKPFARLSLGEGEAADFEAIPPIAVERKHADPLTRLREFVAQANGAGARVLLLADSPGRRETIAQLLTEHHLPPSDNADFAAFLATDAPLALGVAPLHGGFSLR